MMKKLLTIIFGLFVIAGILIAGSETASLGDQVIAGTTGVCLMSFGCFSLAFIYRK